MSMDFVPHDPWESIDGVLGDRERNRENSARFASVMVEVESTGQGELRLPKVLNFKTVFVERPDVSHGFYFDDELLVDGWFPRVTAGVRDWRRNQRGHYLGAYVYFAIDVPDLYVGPAIVMKHSFTFNGIAMKDLPDYLLDD